MDEAWGSLSEKIRKAKGSLAALLNTYDTEPQLVGHSPTQRLGMRNLFGLTLPPPEPDRDPVVILGNRTNRWDKFQEIEGRIKQRKKQYRADERALQQQVIDDITDLLREQGELTVPYTQQKADEIQRHRLEVCRAEANLHVYLNSKVVSCVQGLGLNIDTGDYLSNNERSSDPNLWPPLRVSGVYVLWNVLRMTCDYVGQSGNIRTRLQGHPIFDRSSTHLITCVYMIPKTRHRLDLETSLIHSLLPLLNERSVLN